MTTEELYAQMRNLLDSGRTDPGVEAEARALITQIIQATTQPPPRPLPVAYGSPAWRKLPDRDPRKREAIVDAAEAWRVLVESPYATEILSAYYEWDQRHIISEWSSDIAEQNHGHTPGPSYRELDRRRHLPGPRPGDYRGGPVSADWDEDKPSAGEAA